MTSPELTAADLAARTRRTFALLRRLRRAHLRDQAGNAAFTAYAAVIGLLVYGGLLLPWLRRLSNGRQHAADAARLALAAPSALTAIVLLAMLAVLRDALWRGPVTLPVPAASWLLPLPISRRRLLLPRLRNQLVIGAFGGAVLGAVTAIVLTTAKLTGTGGFWPLLGLSAGSFAATGLLAVATATLVERYRLGDRLVRGIGPVVVVVALALAVQSGLAGYGHGLATLNRIELWSGPWGWAVQPVLAAAGQAEPGWPAALAALVVLAVALTLAALRICADIPGRTLRARASAVAGFAAGMVTMNPRAAALEVRAARGRPVRALRLPAPHRAALIIAWRDATGLLRAPSRPAWAVVLTAAGFLLVTLSTSTGKLPLSLAMLAGGLAAGYLAVAQLTEPARLDADDPNRATHLPYTFESLAMRHAVVPLIVAGVLAEVCATIAAVLGNSATPLAIPIISVPALLAAALVSAYRGPIPSSAFGGVDTPMGNMGMVQVAGWYAAGPLVAIVLLLPPMHIVTAGHATGGSLINYVLWGLAVAAVLIFWARHRAAARAKSTRP